MALESRDLDNFEDIMESNLYPHLILAPAEKQLSTLERLSPEDRASMLDWWHKQTLGPNGSVNLVAWPGMADALMRSISNRGASQLHLRKTYTDQ